MDADILTTVNELIDRAIRLRVGTRFTVREISNWDYINNRSFWQRVAANFPTHCLVRSAPIVLTQEVRGCFRVYEVIA
jgi:hypothetical protein